ncbi:MULTISPECIES: aldo/keto reductase [Bacillus]|uniref:aldo/keto reductase n=1 Tax=Bacillus TaxID=1386 RepID=UPI001B3A801E
MPSSEDSVTHCLKENSIRQEVKGSLRPLGFDEIDLYQIHWPYPEEDYLERWQTLAKLQQEGKVRYIGVSNFKRTVVVFPKQSKNGSAC